MFNYTNIPMFGFKNISKFDYRNIPMIGCTNISKFNYTNIPMLDCTRVHTLTTFRPWRLPGHHGSPDGHRDQRPALHRHRPQDLRLLLLHLTHYRPLHPLLLRGPLQGRGPLRCWRRHLWHWWRCCSEGLLREWQVHWSCPGGCCKNISVLSSEKISVEFIVKIFDYFTGGSWIRLQRLLSGLLAELLLNCKDNFYFIHDDSVFISLFSILYLLNRSMF